MNKLLSVKNKTVLITGAAGLLGSEFVKYLWHEGANIIAWDLKDGPKHERLNWQIVDIGDYKQVEEALTEYLAIDAVVCNAAIDFPPGRINILPKEEVFKTNILGSENCIILGAKKMIGGGSIILIGSIYGMVSPYRKLYGDWAKPSLYSVTKSALSGMTKYWAAHLAPENVRVNLLVLGGIDSGQDRDFVKKYSERVPLQRMAVTEDYCGAVQYLISDASRYQTGSKMVIDGGYTAW